MRRHDREKPLPGWEARNKRGPGATHPDYRNAQLRELREQGEALIFRKRKLIEQIEEGKRLGEDTDSWEADLATLQGEAEQLERKIQKHYRT